MSNQMIYANIPYVDKPVSRIFYGTAIMPFLAGGDGNAILDDMFSLGINAIDTARNYMAAEVSVGNWLEHSGKREEIVLLSKCGHPSVFGRKRLTEYDMKKDLRKSLGFLKTDYIDIYLLHRDDPEVPAGTIVEIFNEMRAAGKIRAFGASNWTHERISEANEYAYAHNLVPFAVASPNFGLADQVRDPWGGGCTTISGPANAPARAWFRDNQMPVVAYSSLGRGLFSGKLKYEDRANAASVLDGVAMQGYADEANFERLRRCELLAEEKGCRVPQIAMAWIHKQGINTFAVVSTANKDRMQQNIDALHIALTDEETAWLDLRREAR